MTTPVDIVIVACGAQKAPGPAPLPELYTGAYFQACLRYARILVTEDRRIGVLSALHGLAPLSARLMAYDTRLGDPDAVTHEEVRAQAEQVGVLNVERLVVLGGAAYVALARQVWPHAEAPLEGKGGIGKQLQWLAQQRTA